MKQEERWAMMHAAVCAFIEANRRMPSRHRIEDHEYLNWLKVNRKMLRHGEMKPERVAPFRQLLDLAERYKRKNQYG